MYFLIKVFQPNYSALHQAVLFGDKKDVEALVDRGAYPDKADDGRCPGKHPTQ